MRHVTVIPNGDIMIFPVDCRLACVFCPEGIVRAQRHQEELRQSASRMSMLRGALSYFVSKRRERKSTERQTTQSATIVEEFAFVLPTIQADEVVLAAHDILEFDRLFELLEICRANGKKVSLISPGLRLADLDFARRLSEHVSCFTITYLSDNQETYRKLTGSTEALSLVSDAIRNLKQLGMDFSVNFVATRHNVKDLMGVARFLLDEIGSGSFTVVFFIPEQAHFTVNPSIADLFATFAELNREILKFVQEYQGSRKMLVLGQIPPCRLDEAILQCRNVKYSPPPPADDVVGLYRHKHCRKCKYEERCPLVFRAYQEKFPAESFDFEKVNRNVHKLEG